MNKWVLLGIFVAIFVAGVAVIMSSSSVSMGELLGSMKELNSRVLSLIALPFVAVLFVLGIYLRKKSEERMWKQAMLKTRARK